METLLYLENVVTLQLDLEKCIGCGLCLEVCPRGVLGMEKGCSRNCPTGAFTVGTGPGCATAVLNSMLGRKGDCCCCLDDGEGKEGGSSSSCCC
ncbi:MAG: NADH dehydrogenase subunit I [Syntrophus sp. PtaU1.Bin208]|nr:MAG: NADH dehydrogenase subunit I [Syntrophus sp. PtaU1.Bin208]